MKSINIIIVILTLAYATVSAKAQIDNDTVKINYKGKSYEIQNKMEPEEEERSKTLRFRDTINKKVTLIKVTTKRDDGVTWESETSAIKNDSQSNKQKIISAFKKKSDINKRKHLIEIDYFTSFLLGTVNLMTENNINSNAKLETIPFKSVNFSAEYLKIDMNLYKNRIRLTTGFGMSLYMMKFNKPKNKYFIDGAGHLNYSIDSTKDVKKNRYDIFYFTIPIALEYHDKKDKFKISAGAEFGFLSGVDNTQKGKLIDGTYKEVRENIDLKLNPNQINALLKIGYRDFTLFARYGFTNIFKSDAFASGQNPNQRFLSIGFSIAGF